MMFWFAVLVIVAGVDVRHLVDLVRHDGYGAIPPPRSHTHEVPMR